MVHGCFYFYLKIINDVKFPSLLLAFPITNFSFTAFSTTVNIYVYV